LISWLGGEREFAIWEERFLLLRKNLYCMLRRKIIDGTWFTLEMLRGTVGRDFFRE